MKYDQHYTYNRSTSGAMFEIRAEAHTLEVHAISGHTACIMCQLGSSLRVQALMLLSSSLKVRLVRSRACRARLKSVKLNASMTFTVHGLACAGCASTNTAQVHAF